MTIVLNRYTDPEGNNATISMEKDSLRYTLTISEPINGKPGFAQTILKRDYMSKKAAKQAMKKYGNFTEGGK